MAEIQLFLGDLPGDGQYSDGDILFFFTDKRIKSVHAQHIGSPYTWDKNGDGYLDINSLPYKVLNRTSEYRFERISKNECQRITLATQTIEDVSDTMDVDQFVSRRLPAWNGSGQRGRPIFGSEGSEIWFGGDRNWDAVDDVWNDIETDTDYRKADHTYWPGDGRYLYDYLVLSVDDKTDAEAEALMAPVTEQQNDSTVILKKRAYKVSWQDISEISSGSKIDIPKPNIKFECRNEGTHTCSNIVVAK